MQREIVNSTAHPSRQPQHLVCWRMQKEGPLSKFGGSNGNFRIIQTSSPALCGRSNWITRTSPVMMKRGGRAARFSKNNYALFGRRGAGGYKKWNPSLLRAAIGK